MIIKIKIDKPPGTDYNDIAEFIHDALSSWGGQKHPEDPLFHSFRHRISEIVVAGKLFTSPDYDKAKQE